ncbi:MAG: hypothetical protein VX252_05265 [Myxococcota bacterium]|nr:hypothetical protein [Myxococcota bacterium]
MRRGERRFSFRAVLAVGLLGSLLFFGCKSGEPSSSSSGFCSGGAVTILDDSQVAPFCLADARPTVTMSASTLNCPIKYPPSTINVICNGGPGDWTDCRFSEFEFSGLSLEVASTFAGEFECDGASGYTAVFSPASAVGEKPASETIRVSFEVR